MDEKKFKILLVEDDSLDQMAFKRMVEQEKLLYDCTIASSLAEARKVLDGKEFDVIISDYSLGDGTALDVLNLAKDIPVILVTGADDRETAVKVWRAGAYDYLTKDVEREYLKTIRITIENAVGQHEMKKSLDRKQKNLEAIFDAAPICMLLIDENMNVVRVNEAVRQMVGREQLEITNRSPGSALGCSNSFNDTGRCGENPGCGSCLLRKTVNSVIANGEPVNKVEMQLILKVRDKLIEPWLSISAKPVNIDEKKCVVVALDDITSRKQAEEARRASEEQYRILFEQAADAIWLVDGDTKDMVEFNSKAHQSLGYSKEEFTKLGIKDIDVAQTVEEIRSHIKKILEQGSDNFETKHRRKDGEIRDVQTNGKVVWIKGRRLIQVVVSDITERKRAEDKLRETMELKSRFISTVSHELRTPLTCIKEAVDAVLEGVAGQINDKQKNFLELVHRNIDRLTMLINDVLDFQRLESGRTKIDIIENDMGEVIKSVDEIMSVAAKQKDINYVIEQDGKLPKMWFDLNKIIQVATNLVSNAIKFTPAGGTVTVSILRHGDEVMLRVRDTGMGIPKESLAKIFERFYRVSRPGKEIQGTGLGLSIVRKIVDLHRGRIEVESEPDKGATFTIFMPFDARPHKEVLPGDADEAIEASLSGNSVKSQ